MRQAKRYELSVLAEDFAVKRNKVERLGKVDLKKLAPLQNIQAQIDYHIADAEMREAMIRLELAKRHIEL